MAHKPKYARQEPRRNTALKLLPLVLVAIVAVVLIVRSLGKGKPDDAPTTPPTTEATQPLEPVASATVGVQGDLLMHKPVITACTTEDGGYDFASIFRYVAEYTASYDYSVANLETTLGGDNYPYQGYPDFNCPDEIAEAAKDAGIDMLLTANNHAGDNMASGITRTIEVIRGKGLTALGSQLNADEPKYAVVDVNGIKIGMVCYTWAYGSNGTSFSLNGLTPIKDEGQMNYFLNNNPDKLYTASEQILEQMKADGAEATMMFIHWGVEYNIKENALQDTMAQKLCDLGVDVIVGGHPHVVEPMELLTSGVDSRHKTAVIYSLGNAVSNQRRDLMTLNTGHTEDGAVFTVTFEKYADGAVHVADVNVMPTWVILRSVDEKQEYSIVPLEDARREEWQSLYGLDAAALANAVASYDRTMSIVGPGLEQCRSYYTQEKQAREAPAVPTEEAA